MKIESLKQHKSQPVQLSHHDEIMLIISQKNAIIAEQENLIKAFREKDNQTKNELELFKEQIAYQQSEMKKSQSTSKFISTPRN